MRASSHTGHHCEQSLKPSPIFIFIIAIVSILHEIIPF
jgi:hypothetical protein